MQKKLRSIFWGKTSEISVKNGGTFRLPERNSTRVVPRPRWKIIPWSQFMFKFTSSRGEWGYSHTPYSRAFSQSAASPLSPPGEGEGGEGVLLTLPLHRSSGLTSSKLQPSFFAPSITRFWFSRASWMFLTLRWISEGDTVPLLMRFNNLLQNNVRKCQIERLIFISEHGRWIWTLLLLVLLECTEGLI